MSNQTGRTLRLVNYVAALAVLFFGLLGGGFMPQPVAKAEESAAPAATAASGLEAAAQLQSALLAANVPFQLRLESFLIDDYTGLHSMPYANHDGKLVLAAGRTNGMHGFPMQRGAGFVDAFPKELANDKVYVLDLSAKKLEGSAPVADLPAKIANQLVATNTQYFTRDGWWYIVGGYAPTANGNSMVTLDQVIAIDLHALIDAVSSGGKLDVEFAKQHIHIGDHPALAITGGMIGLNGQDVLLAFGHMFNGLYTTDGSLAQQEYSQAVRAVRITRSYVRNADGVKTLIVKYLGKDPDPPATEPQPLPDGPYHRRDYTLVPIQTPGGTPLLGAFGGVFKGGRMEGYLHPVYITPDSRRALGFRLTEDKNTAQLLSQYECATLPLYSARRKTMFTTFFGGISQFYWDPQSKALKRDKINFNATPPVDGLPFINSISTLRVEETQSTNYLHVNEAFPPEGQEPRCGKVPVPAPYLGTNSIFVPAANLPIEHGVIQLDRIGQPTHVGDIVGGIAAVKPYPGPATCASEVIYRVWLDPTGATETVELSLPRSPQE